MGSIRTCRICGSSLPDPFLDLGNTPLANAFLKSEEEFAGEVRYPLAVTACVSCGLAQLTHVVPAEQLYRDYIYVSSTSDSVRAHAESLADGLVRRYGWGPDDLVVEVASNDGTVLKAFKRREVRVLGIEPARNIAAIAEADGVPTVADFFTERVAARVVDEYGPAAAIVGRHVFAHVDDLHDFLRGVKRLLRPAGLLIIEVPYFGDLVDKLEFDTVYHEHLSYFSLGPIDQLCERHDLRLVDIERISLHGGSVILSIQRAAQAGHCTPRLETMRAQEDERAILSAASLATFAAEVRRWKTRFEALVDGLGRQGATLIGYGAAAKGNTLLNFCPAVARTLECILDRSPHKHGRYTPGTHVRVAPAETWRDSSATHMLVLAWNFKDEIMRQMQPFAARGGRFVIPLPVPVVV